MDMADWPTTEYTLTRRAYMPRFPGSDHELLEEQTKVVWDGKPGPHMEPLTDEGREAVQRAGPQVLDFTQHEPLSAGDDEDKMAARIAKAVATAMIQMNVQPTQRAAPAPPEVRRAPTVMAAPPPPPPPPPPVKK
jgi:hypothetical protein